MNVDDQIEPISADDVRDHTASMSREAWSGRPFPEEEIAVLRQVLRSSRDDQPGASAAVKALAAAVLEL